MGVPYMGVGWLTMMVWMAHSQWAETMVSVYLDLPRDAEFWMDDVWAQKHHPLGFKQHPLEDAGICIYLQKIYRVNIKRSPSCGWLIGILIMTFYNPTQKKVGSNFIPNVKPTNRSWPPKILTAHCSFQNWCQACQSRHVMMSCTSPWQGSRGFPTSIFPSPGPSSFRCVIDEVPKQKKHMKKSQDFHGTD